MHCGHSGPAGYGSGSHSNREGLQAANTGGM